MAGKFVDLKDAAKLLGVTPEELVEMRSKGQIFGYRDGASWKFRMEEVDRVNAEHSVSGSGSAILGDAAEFEELMSGLSSKILENKTEPPDDAILITEEELGQSAEKTSSTIIGKGGKKSSADSDLQLNDSSIDALGTGSDKLLEAPGAKLKGKEGSDVLGSSGISLQSAGSGTGDLPPVKPGSGTADIPKGGVKGGGGSSIRLGEELKTADDDLELGSDDALDDDSEIQLAESDSKKGSDVTGGGGNSGINLKPSDSGINLEDEPLDLGGSAVESLELPEDDDIIALDDEAAPLDEGSQIKTDDQFMLSPSDSLTEDESDSGSQVIALEDSSSFDENAATMLNQQGGESALVPEDAFAMAGGMAGPGMMTPGASPAGMMAASYAAPPELNYSIYNILSLMLVFGMLSLCAMLMVDLMLNMWSFDEPASFTSGVMDSLISMFGLDKT